jgi:exodeoxyribonuclease V gamma subunit
VNLDIAGESWSVETSFAELRSGGLVRWRYDDERARDLLDAWIHHLLLCASPPPGATLVTRWIARDGVRAYAPLPVEKAQEQLHKLVAIYRRGLAEPVPFFAKTSWAWFDRGESAARDAWNGRLHTGDSARPGAALAFRGRPDPLSAEFEELATEVFGGVTGASEKTSLHAPEVQP